MQHVVRSLRGHKSSPEKAEKCMSLGRSLPDSLRGKWRSFPIPHLSNWLRVASSRITARGPWPRTVRVQPRRQQQTQFILENPAGTFNFCFISVKPWFIPHPTLFFLHWRNIYRMKNGNKSVVDLELSGLSTHVLRKSIGQISADQRGFGCEFL